MFCYILIMEKNKKGPCICTMEKLGCTAEINTTLYINYNKKNSLQITNPVVVQSLSHVQLFCNSIDCSPSGFSVPKIFQARILEWVTISFSRGSSRPRDRTCISCIGRILYHWATREAPTNAVEGVNKRELLHCWWECKLVWPLWKKVWKFLRKLKIELLYDPGILSTGHRSRENSNSNNNALQCSWASRWRQW